MEQLDTFWFDCCVVDKWPEGTDHRLMSRFIAVNGLAVGLWVGASYVSEMIDFKCQ